MADRNMNRNDRGQRSRSSRDYEPDSGLFSSDNDNYRYQTRGDQDKSQFGRNQNSSNQRSGDTGGRFYNNESYGDRYFNQHSSDRGFGGSFDDHNDQSRMGQSRSGSFSNSSYDSRTSHAGRGPKGWQRSDERIQEEVCERLSMDHDIDASEIEVSVKDGIVHLKGKSDSRRSKRLAEDLIEDLSGVKDVRNEISVDQSFFEQAKELLTGKSSESSKSRH